MDLTVLSILLGLLGTTLYILLHNHSKARESYQHDFQVPVAYPHIDPIFGLDLKFQEIRQSWRYRRIPHTAQLFQRYGKTIEVNNFGVSTIRTIDPENLQAAYAVNEKDWGYEPLRLPVMGPFCGRGFITTDGSTWKHSRALLRPTFSKSNISDLSAFGTSVNNFLRKIPRDGSSVDLQPLLSTLFLDTSIKFLLGESLGALVAEDSTEVQKRAQAFLKAFQTSLIGIGLSFMLGPFRVLIPKSMKSVAWQQAHQYIDSCIDDALHNQKSMKKQAEPVK